MNKKKENKNEAGIPVPREKTEPGTTSVVGDHDKLFENGKLREPKKSAEELLEEQKAKNPKTAKKIEKMEKDATAKLKKAQTPKPTPEKVSVPDKWSRVATYSVNSEASNREVQLLNQLEKIKDLQILPKDTASFKLKTVTGNHSVGIIDTLKVGFSVKIGQQGEQYKVSEDKQVDTILSDVGTELERISKLPKKQKTGGKPKASQPKNTIGKPELMERLDATDSKKFHMKGADLTRTAREYCKKQKIGIRESKDGFVFSKN